MENTYSTWYFSRQIQTIQHRKITLLIHWEKKYLYILSTFPKGEGDPERKPAISPPVWARDNVKKKQKLYKWMKGHVPQEKCSVKNNGINDDICRHLSYWELPRRMRFARPARVELAEGRCRHAPAVQLAAQRSLKSSSSLIQCWTEVLENFKNKYQK
jgi:hypothetical protein